MPLYSKEKLIDLDLKRSKWCRDFDDLSLSFLLRTYKTEIAGEYVAHGLVRRVHMILHSTSRLFETIPPEGIDHVSDEVRHDAEAFIHSFLVNIFGALDNMARIWCKEADIRTPKGRPLSDGMIGLGPKNELVRSSFSLPFREYLIHCDPWFEYLESYRHAVAHRIPVYIPPSRVGPKDIAEYERLEAECGEALKEGNLRRFSALRDKQRKLGEFVPMMMHSFGERAKPVTIHAQLVCDIATLTEIGQQLMGELEALA